MKRFALAIALLLICASVSDAARWRFGRRSRVRYSSSYSAVQKSSVQKGPQALAYQKASICAANGRCYHVGGGYGGGRAEGVGWSSYSAQAALNNCCYTGQRRVAGSAVVRGSRGWYAVKIYW